MKTNTIQKLIFSIIILLVFLYTNFFLFSKINDKHDYISETKKTIVVESAKTNSFSDTKRKIAELNNINNRINNVLIDGSNAVSFISLIEEMASSSQSEIQINNVDFDDSEGEGKLGVLNMKFKIIGEWSQVNNFLASVESLPYLITIDSIRFSSTNNESGSLWSIDFGLIGLTN